MTKVELLYMNPSVIMLFSFSSKLNLTVKRQFWFVSLSVWVCNSLSFKSSISYHHNESYILTFFLLQSTSKWTLLYPYLMFAFSFLSVSFKFNFHSSITESTSESHRISAFLPVFYTSDSSIQSFLLIFIFWFFTSHQS